MAVQVRWTAQKLQKDDGQDHTGRTTTVCAPSLDLVEQNHHVHACARRPTYPNHVDEYLGVHSVDISGQLPSPARLDSIMILSLSYQHSLCLSLKLLPRIVGGRPKRLHLPAELNQHKLASEELINKIHALMHYGNETIKGFT